MRLGLIGGSGLEELLTGSPITLRSSYGNVPSACLNRIGRNEVIFAPRHGLGHETLPHRVNYRAIIGGLRNLGVERIVATNAVGAINEVYAPGEMAIPIDIIDFTVTRPRTFFDVGPASHLDVTEPYCHELRECLIAAAKSQSCRVQERVVMACTEGPRFETPAEIRMMRQLGCDVVGMTSAPEVFLAREAGICYASLSFITNMAAGMQDRVSHEEVLRLATRLKPMVNNVVIDALERLGPTRSCRCGPLRNIGGG